MSLPPLRRAAAAFGAAAFVGWTAATLPFYPLGWSWGVAALAAGTAALRPRLGLALALGLAILPLGNVSVGLAVLYTALAAAWLVLTWRRSDEGLLPVVGALLAPLGLVMLLPALLLPVRRAVWRAGFGAAAVVAAGLFAGIRGTNLPLSERAAASPGFEGMGAPGAAAAALLGSVAARPELVLTALVVAVLAALLPLAAERGVWAVAGLGAASIPALLLPIDAVNAFPAVAGVWLCCTAVIVRADVLRR